MKEKPSVWSPIAWKEIAIKAFRRLRQNDPLMLAGATAFFATFSITPILIIIIQVLGIIFKPDKLRAALFDQLSEAVSPQTVQQLAKTLRGFHELASTWYMAVIGFLFLLFVASTLFKVIESSFKRLWRLRLVKRRTIGYRLRSRVFAIAIALAAGILLASTLLAEGLQAYVGQQLSSWLPGIAGYLKSALKHIVSLLIAAIWFAIVFRYLTDARPSWRSVLASSVLTSVFFNIGKIILHYTLQNSNINTLYGASTSLVFLLLFVFYSSFIFYYGAAFTIAWCRYFDEEVPHPDHVSFYKIVEQESEEP